MRNTEIFKRLADRSAARDANIALAKEASRPRVIAEPTTRRGFHLPRIVALPLLPLLAVAAGFGCGDANTQESKQQEQINALSTVVKGLTPHTPSPTLVPRAESTATVTATVTPKANEIAGGAEIASNLFSIHGIPDRVDAKNVDTAKGVFINTIPGTEHVLAEPGSLLVGPDFPQATIDQSGGHIDRFNPGNQYILQTEGPSYANVAEGAFLMASGATMNVEVGGVNIQLNGEKGRNWLLLVKGRFADGKQDSDLNLTAKFTKYVPGHVLVTRHPAGAFVSEGQFKQMAATSHDGGSNCGNEGCSKLSALLLDINTGVYIVVEQVGKDQPWTIVASNFR